MKPLLFQPHDSDKNQPSYFFQDEINEFTLINLCLDNSPVFLTHHCFFICVHHGKLKLQIENSIIECNKGEAIFVNAGYHCHIEYPKNSLSDTHITVIPILSAWISSFNQRYSNLCNNSSQNTAEESAYYELSSSNPIINQSGKNKSHSMVDKLYCHFPTINNLNVIEHLYSELVQLTKETDISVQHTLKKQTLAHLLLCDLIILNPQLHHILNNCEHTSLSDKIRTLILNDLSKTWTIAELAECLNMSSATLRRKITHEAGSLVDFITQIKMIESLRLLRRSNKSITEIASQLGYCSAAYFSYVFKKSFNVIPSDIRKN